MTCWRAASPAGLLSQFVIYAVLAAGEFGELSQVWGEISAAAGAAGRIGEILALKPGIVAPVPAAPLPTPRAAQSASSMSISPTRARPDD